MSVPLFGQVFVGLLDLSHGSRRGGSLPWGWNDHPALEEERPGRKT